MLGFTCKSLKMTLFIVLILATISLINVVQSDNLTAEEWTNFVREVEEAIESYYTYVLPTDNAEFFTNVSETQEDLIDFGTYDFIIIGGGTAGGVLANRLTEEPYTVLVLEAGTHAPAWADVLGLSSFSYRSDYVWGYKTTAQTKSCLGSPNQQCFYPRGKALGGSSVVNGGLYVRGNAKDYDQWEALGNPGWSYQKCLPYFKKAENARFASKEPGFHGSSGLQAVDVAEDTPGLTSTLLEAFGSIGKRELDYNGHSQNGAGRAQFFLDYNMRASTAHAFLDAFVQRRNLEIALGAFVTRVQIVQQRAEAVEFIQNGRRYLASARKEVILSAGAINSPQVLMLSGVGPKEELRRLGVEVKADLPVGRNLLDHVSISNIFYRTNHTFYNDISLPESLDLWREAKRPLVAGIAAQIISFLNFEGGRPEIEIYVTHASPALPEVFQMNQDVQEVFQQVNQYTDIAINVVLLHPRSVGKVTLQSSNPKDYPLIDTNYLSDPEDKDIETLYKGIQAMLRLNESKAFQDFQAQLFVNDVPGCEEMEKMSKEWWYCAVRTVTHTLFHPVGTTRMGPNPQTSVVNSELRVHGIRKLRVVDAGVIPELVSGHTNAAVVMLAEKMADSLKADQQFCQKSCLKEFLHSLKEVGGLACQRRKRLLGCVKSKEIPKNP